MNMCNFWSALIDRNGKVHWSEKNSSHEELVKQSGFKDDKLEDRDFVRIEITPKNNMAIFSKKEADWVFKIDEKKTLPEWYSKNQEKMEKLCWLEWKNAMKKTLWKLNLEKAEDFITKEIPEIPWFKFNGKIRKEWHLSIGTTLVAAGVAARDAAGDAARDAARDAAWVAAGVAARVAAGDAARDAAWDAARDAAWVAAWVAAGVAARVAAGDAARDAAVFVRILLCPKIELKHRHHVEARMDVWRQGYGLRCDVNGKLYVYGVKLKG